MCCFLTDDVWSRFGERAAVRMCCFRAKVAVRPAQDGFLWAHLQSLSTTNSFPLSFFSVSSLPLALPVSGLNLGGSPVSPQATCEVLYACEDFIPSPLSLSLRLEEERVTQS